MKHRDAVIAVVMIFSAGVGYWMLLRQFNIQRLVNRGAVIRVTPEEEPYRIDLQGPEFGDVDLKLLQPAISLEEIILSESQVTDAGIMHLLSLPHLKRIDLSHTKITDSALKQLASVENLETLNLSGTAITDRGLAHFKGHPHLTILRLDGCRDLSVAGLLALRQCPRLIHFDLLETPLDYAGYCQLLEVSPQVSLVVDEKVLLGLESSKTLSARIRRGTKEIHLSLELPASQNSNATPSTTLKDLMQMPGQQNVLSATFVFGRGMNEDALAALQLLPNLSRLSMQGEINKEVIVEIGRHHNLEQLSISDFEVAMSIHPTSEITPIPLLPLGQLQQLVHLNLNLGSVDRQSLKSLENLEKLEILSISRCQLEDADVTFLTRLTQLSSVSLYGHQLGPATLEILRSLPQLTSADLRANNMDDAVLTKFHQELQQRRQLSSDVEMAQEPL